MDIPKTSATETDYIRGFFESQRMDPKVPTQPDIKNVVPPPKNFMTWLAKISHRQIHPIALAEWHPSSNPTNKE